MRATLFSILIFSAFFFSFQKTYAQVGWTWGVGSKNGNIDQWGGTAIDASGNVFVSMMNDDRDTVRLGTLIIPNPNRSVQLIITKADSLGNFQWAVNSLNDSGLFRTLKIATDAEGNLYVFG